MPLGNVDLGKHYVGLIADGQSETPWVPGSLQYDAEEGIAIDVPFIVPSVFEEKSSESQFAVTRSWFRMNQLPKNLVFCFDKSFAALFSTSLRRVSYPITGGYAQATITADTLVISRKTPNLGENLVLGSLTSELDRLLEWTGFSGLRREWEVNDDKTLKNMTISTQETQSVEWRVGDLTLRIRSRWKTDGDWGTYAGLRGYAEFETTFDAQRPVSEHLEAHRRIRSLVVLADGSPSYFRAHRTSDSNFDPDAQVLHWETSEDFAADSATSVKTTRPGLSTLGGKEALERWFSIGPDWERAINPIVGLLQRANYVVEELMTTTMISLETMGNLLRPVEHEEQTKRGSNPRSKPTTATYALRCLLEVSPDWSHIAETPVGLARAMANTYNSIKHFDRGSSPHLEDTLVLGQLALALGRWIALKRAAPTNIEKYLQNHPELIGEVLDRFNGRRVGHDGKFYRPEGTEEEPRSRGTFDELFGGME